MNIKAELTNNSIEKLGISKDFKVCISEYIWNGFDAKASRIEINSIANYLGAIESIEIIDNGMGINYDELDYTFKKVLDSKKTTKERKGNIHGYKGKGRFSFISFSECIKWSTIYRNNNGSNKKYTIKINRETANEYELSNVNSCNEEVGTKVIISNIEKNKILSFDNLEFINYLKEKFAWFLYLNREKNFKIILNGAELDYMTWIDEDVSETFSMTIESFDFKINFIKWNNRIDEKYYFYFLNSDGIQTYKKTTSFNNKSLGFPHSMYVESDYFNEFFEKKSKQNIETQEELMQYPNQTDKIFKLLEKELINILKEKAKIYTKIKAPKEIIELEKSGAFPEFKQNRYDALRKEDLKEVLTEIYIVQPKVFKGTLEQKKTIVGFLNLLLETDEREGILNIMESVNELSSEERKQLNDVLRKTTLSRILRTVSMIERRLNVIETLKVLVHDMTKFTNERDHIQKIVEDNYWLFGESYNLVSADRPFEISLKNYLYILDGKDETYNIDNYEKLRRPDIFMCRTRSIYSESTEDEENIIVELKAPSVILNKKIFRQIEDYMDLISNESQFNSDIRKWKFIMVSEKVDDYIKELYKSWKDKGKRFLVRGGSDFEIYAMTWDDVFKNFELNHKYILKKLDFDKSRIQEEIKGISEKEGRELVNELVQNISKLQSSL